MSELHTVDVEKRLHEKRDDFVLKKHFSAKSDVWKHFSLVFEKRREETAASAWRIADDIIVSIEVEKVHGREVWSSIKAFHWMASFLDPTFKSFQFTPPPDKT